MNPRRTFSIPTFPIHFLPSSSFLPTYLFQTGNSIPEYTTLHRGWENDVGMDMAWMDRRGNIRRRDCQQQCQRAELHKRRRREKRQRECTVQLLPTDGVHSPVNRWRHRRRRRRRRQIQGEGNALDSLTTTRSATPSHAKVDCVIQSNAINSSIYAQEILVLQ